MFRPTIFAGMALLLLLAAGGCEMESHTEQDPPPQRHEPRTRKTEIVRFTFISRYNPTVMLTEYGPFLDYLSRSTPYDFELVLAKDYEEAITRLCEGDVHMASLGGLTYLEAAERCSLRIVCRPLNRQHEPSYRSTFIVREESPIRTLAAVRGHTLGLASPHSTSGALVPIHELRSAGIVRRDLKSVEFLPHHDSVAKAVLSGVVEVGAVKDIVAEKFANGGLRVIHRSPRIPSVPIVAGSACKTKMLEAVRAALVKRQFAKETPDPEERAWNREFLYGFEIADSSDYEALLEIREELRATGDLPEDWSENAP